MIESIKIENEASYGSPGEILSGLSKHNFIYGSNGTGKTTISKVVANESAFSDCSLVWRGGIKLETLVYNRDFVEKNFDQSSELKGIFTLGEKDKEALDKIKTTKQEVDSLNSEIQKLKKTLEKDDDNGGKNAELAELESKFEEKCWKLKQKHDEKLQGAFVGVRGKKSAFKSKLLAEAANNSGVLKNLDEVENKAETIFGEMPQTETTITVPNYESLLRLESASILKKKVIGKADVDIAAMIQKLGNSDWVKQGRFFYEANENVCPFCQQKTESSFADSLNEYFDETFEKDVSAIETLLTNYKTNGERLQQSLQSVLDNPSKFLDVDKLKAEKELLDSKISINLQRIEKKRSESSQSIELDFLENVLTEIKKLIDSANSSIREHNKMVSNLAQEKNDLTEQIWKYLLENEIKDDLATYKSKRDGLEKAIVGITKQITNKKSAKRTKENEIKKLEKDTTSIQPTINGINDLLKSFGFNSFFLAKSENERFYKIQRPDGTDAKETLSEGEKSFITFLYFYHLLKGSEYESGMTTDRVVVFDDPVSSLDSDILFVVCSLIKGLFDEVRNNNGHIKQIFVLTHNVYFHKEVTFNPKRSGQALNEETFWTVRKSSRLSKIKKHDTNPIKTSYELLWLEVKNADRSNLTIQNILRRILENYFKILGSIDPDTICDFFEGKDKLICKSLFSWVNDGSHFAHDDLYISLDELMISNYLRVFSDIFIKTGHEAHYNMMMGEAFCQSLNI
ncbi:MAG: AAA family ATPase [Gammaproteobacteria bacterium]|nr:AAA family ATPase [Gammaproteobacteria bacterium]